MMLGLEKDALRAMVKRLRAAIGEYDGQLAKSNARLHIIAMVCHFGLCLQKDYGDNVGQVFDEFRDPSRLIIRLENYSRFEKVRPNYIDP